MIKLAGFMTSIGDTLHAERVRRHLDIQAIARELKIPAKFLEAIEKDQFDKLPAPVFARSFVKQYARYLGMTDDDLVSALQRLFEPPPSLAEPSSEKPETPIIQVDRMAEWESVGERRSWSSSLPALALVVVAMLGCSGVYAWWQRNRHAVSAHEAGQAAVSSVKGQEAAPGSLEPAPPPNTATLVRQASTAEAAKSPVPAVNSALDQAARRDGETAANAAGAPGTPAGPPGPVHVQVTASALVWVSAKADDKSSFSGTLQASQSRTIDAQHTVVLRLGNAGGADITLNGKSIGPVGPKGQPRTVQLTSGGFQIVAPPKSPDLLDPLR